MKHESVNLMTSARHELGHLLAMKRTRSIGNQEVMVLGGPLTQTGITQFRKSGIEGKTELLAKNKWMRNS